MLCEFDGRKEDKQRKTKRIYDAVKQWAYLKYVVFDWLEKRRIDVHKMQREIGIFFCFVVLLEMQKKMKKIERSASYT